MKEHPVEFAGKGLPFVDGILFYPGNTDIDLAFERLAGAGQGETDDVGIKIVLQKLAVDIEQVRVVAEDVAETFQRHTLLSEKANNEVFTGPALRETKIPHEIMKLNNIGTFVHCLAKIVNHF